jgi:hypothetical protein
MIPTTRLFIKPPEVKTNYIDLPGAEGGLDYTEILTGVPHYGYRKGSWEFFLIPGENWHEVYNSLVSYLHGRQHTIKLEDDPNSTYVGRLQINDWQSSAHNSIITIDYVLNPNTEEQGGGETEEQRILREAAKLLRLPENQGKVIDLVNDKAILVLKESLFDNGDDIYY